MEGSVVDGEIPILGVLEVRKALSTNDGEACFLLAAAHRKIIELRRPVSRPKTCTGKMGPCILHRTDFDPGNPCIDCFLGI